MSKDKKEIDVNELTLCKSTAQMLQRMRADGVENAFERASDMKPCPIGAKSACCKNCAVGPCRLNAKDPYAKNGGCVATIDTIQARNFARMVDSGSAAHSSHGMNMFNLFRDVVEGRAPDYTIGDPQKLKEVAASLGIETEEKDDTIIASEVCEAVGMPPVLGMGSCVDNSRILMAVTEMVNAGGMGGCRDPGT
ncbi:MAG: hypothetical protein K9J85_04955 [Desulfobacteraceae bacterium]|nr:hypothetical protein [Desulfobacteraceae bacterium]